MKPILQALVLAERVWTLEDGRKAIFGTFTKIAVMRRQKLTDIASKPMLFGGEIGSPWVYMSLTGVSNATVLQLNFVSLRRNAVLFSKEITLLGDDRLATVELAFGLPRIAPTESGGYAFDVVCEGEILGSWRLQVEVYDEEDLGETDDAPNDNG